MSESPSLSERYQDHHSRSGRYGFSYRLGERGPQFALWIGVGVRVLDLGCRDGILTEHYVQGNHVIGVDIDPGALARARARLGIETLDLDLNRASLPFDDASFDAVVAGEVLEHLTDPRAVVTEACRVLKPAGVFVGSVPNSFHWRARLAFLQGFSIEDPTHLQQFSRKRLLALLQGFVSVEILPVGGIGGRRLPVLPGSLSESIIRKLPDWFANDWLFRAIKRSSEGQGTGGGHQVTPVEPGS